jgi:hypothetical protein
MNARLYGVAAVPLGQENVPAPPRREYSGDVD